MARFLQTSLVFMAVACVAMTLTTTTTTTMALPLTAMRSLVFLDTKSSTSVSSVSCVAVWVTGQRLITSSSCPVDSLQSIRNVADTSLIHSALDSSAPLTTPTLTLTLEPPLPGSKVVVQWKDLTTQVLSVASAPHSPVSDLLQLPSNETYPQVYTEDKSVRVLHVDAATKRVVVTEQVVYVDQSLCGRRRRSSNSSSSSSTSSMCVLPLQVEDRGVSSGLPASRSWRFLVKQDAATGNDVLLGIGLPHTGNDGTNDDDDDDDDDGFQSFTWLASSFQDASLASLWPGIPTRTPETDEQRVLGAPEAKIHKQNEFLAGLRSTKDGHSFCTGSLIASRFVLTAAHCIDAKSASAGIKWVALATLDTAGGGGGGERIQVERVTRHPQYKSEPYKSANDVAVLQLAKPSSRLPIQLYQEQDYTILNGKSGIVLGYGAMDVDGKTASAVLRAVELPIGPDNGKCAARLQVDTIDSSMFCAGGRAGQDSCHGDSGGPLVIHAGSVDQRLVGVVSWGRGCGHEGLYGVYARVSAALKFIYETVKAQSHLPKDRQPIRPVPRV